MTYMTHKVFAIGWVLIGNMILYTRGVTNVNYYLALIITLQAGKYGALFPDVDHHWASVKEKTAVNFAVNKFIHMTGGKHRSWQTHSWDVWLVITSIGLLIPTLDTIEMSTVNRELFKILWIGFTMGWMSHLVSDMLTGEGVRLFCWRKFKIRFVPKKLGKLRFNTGKEWEQFVYRATRIVNIPLGFVAIIFPMFFTPSGQEFVRNVQENISKLIGG